MHARALHLAFLALVSAACAPLPSAERPEKAPRTASDDAYGNLPLSFVENRGQLANEDVRHYAQSPRGAIGFTPTGLRIGLSDASGTSQRWSVAMDFLGGRATPVAEDPQEGLVSYFKGDRADWHTGIQTHGRLVYRDLWSGIDLVYRADGPKLKYEFVVRPGADPDDIRLRWRGASESRVLPDGSLLVRTPAGSLIDGAPVSFQGDLRVATVYRLEDSIVGFDVDAHDPAETLVIDPVLTLYAGYIGGGGGEGARDIAVDASGAAYVTGETSSTEASFPDAVGPDPTHGGGMDDAFVAKVNPQGTGLVYAGYIGGAGSDRGRGIAVDPTGAAYVTGETTSMEDSFPVEGGPELIRQMNGDAFVAKVNAQGTDLVYAGYIGGNGGDSGNAIAVDGSGSAYVAGDTASVAPDFPATIGPDTMHNGGNDAFVAKLNPQGGIVYAGYIGGADADFGRGVAIDGSGAAYVAGGTESPPASFPEMVGPALTHAGMEDAFVAKVNPGGTGLIYAGYIGGSGVDNAFAGIALDQSGAAYVGGYTESGPSTFPEAVGPSLTFGGDFDAFVAKVTAGGGLDYAGYIGGAGYEEADDIAVDSAGAAYLTGYTDSDPNTFPEAVGPSLTFGGGSDAFVAKVNPGGAALAYAGYFGGAGNDGGSGIAVDGTGAAYVAGTTSSDAATFPETVGPDLSPNGMNDGFVAKMTDNLCLGAAVTIQGTAGNDTLTGTADADVILGLGGNDAIDGAGGNDVICAGDGDDTVIGGAGDDRLDGEAGTDTASFPGAAGVSASLATGTASGLGADTLAGMENLTGSSANDTLTGNASANVLLGGAASDTISGEAGGDRLLGGDGDDTAFGGDGDDELQGEAGKDRLVGQAGNDLLVGGAKADRLSGGGGKDRLRGQGGKDRLSGGGANDRLAGGKGNDRMNGGKGKKDRCNGGKGTKDTATKCETVTGVP